MERQSDTASADQRDGNELIGRRHSTGHGNDNPESGRDIARIARSLGFTPEEVFEIERLYLSVPDGLLK